MLDKGNKYESKAKRFQWVFKVAMGMLALTALLSLVIWLLWNWLMPSITGLKPIDYLQALGLLVLTRLLFGFGKGGPRHAPWQRGGRGGPWHHGNEGHDWGRWEKWKHYKDFWNDEGQQAFEQYVQRKTSEPPKSAE